MEDIPFYIIAALALTGATGVMLFKSLMKAAFSLMGCLTALAALYIYAGAEFLGVTQLLIYVGGIVVILIFGIMLTRVKIDESPFSRGFMGILLALGLAFLLIGMIYKINWPAFQESETTQMHVHEIGVSFFTDHLLAFEMAGLLLLIALIGVIAVTASRR